MKRFIMHEDIPRWYHLYWDRGTEGLFIKIHRFFLDNCEYKNFEPYFKGLYGKASFLPLFDRYESRLGCKFFGINDSISLVDQDEEWMIYRIKIPTIIHRSNFACKSCDGTGRRRPGEVDDREICFYCEGTKTERILDYYQISDVCYSLAILFNALSFPVEKEGGCIDYLQLFTLTSMSEGRAHGHSVGGYGSPEFLRFLESFSVSYDDQVNLPSITEVMRKVHSIIYGKVEKFSRFSCMTRKGQFVLDCPGDACQIHSEPDREVGNGRGDNITCHNLDSAMQQLMLLSGMGEIASLYDDWRASK